MTKKIDHEAIIAELRREALSDPETGWLSDLARKGLDWSENDEVIMLRHVDGSVDVGHLASVVGVLISEATNPLLSRIEQAEQAVQRVRDVIKGAPTVDPLRGFAGPPDDWPDDTHFTSYGEWIMANRVREALDGDPRADV